MSLSYDIIGVGVPYLDFIVQLQEVPSPNQSVPMSGFRLSGGGKVPTALAAASRLGLSTSLVCGLAEDQIGDLIREGLERENISLQFASPARHPAVSVVLADERTNSRTILYRQPDETGASLFEAVAGADLRARMLLISAAGRAERAAIVWAKERRIPIMLDADYADPAFAEIAPDITLFIASEHYFDCQGIDELHRRMKAIAAAGPATVIATQGERGCRVLDGSGGAIRHVPAFEVDAIDTTGAGDVFHGAYAYAYLRHWPAERCAAFASAVSAMKCRKPGGREGIPRLEEVRAFLSASGRPLEGLNF